MVAKCFQSADIILDEPGQRFIIGGGDAGHQPLLVGLGQQPGVYIEDHLRGTVPLPEDGQPAFIIAQKVAGGILRLLRFIGNGIFDRLRGGDGIFLRLGFRLRLRGASTGKKRQHQPQQQGGNGHG